MTALDPAFALMWIYCVMKHKWMLMLKPEIWKPFIAVIALIKRRMYSRFICSFDWALNWIKYNDWALQRDSEIPGSNNGTKTFHRVMTSHLSDIVVAISGNSTDMFQVWTSGPSESAVSWKIDWNFSVEHKVGKRMFSTRGTVMDHYPVLCAFSCG